MKRRTAIVAGLWGLSGCLRLQSSSETGTDRTKAPPTTSTNKTQATTRTTGTTPPAATPSKVEKKWSKGGSGLIAYRDGSVYCTHRGVTAFSSDGTERWSRSVPGNNFQGLNLGPKRLYIPTAQGTIYALDPLTGDKIWRGKLPDGGDARSVPVKFGDKVIISSKDPDQTVALNEETGDVKWTFPAGPLGVPSRRLPIPGTSSPSDDYFFNVTGSDIPILTNNGTVYTTCDVQPTTPLTFDADGAYVGGYNAVGRLYYPSGMVEWTTDVPSRAITKPVVVDNTVIFGTVQNGLFAFNKETGEQEWHNDIGDVHWSPVLYRGKLFTGTSDGNCYVLNPSDGNTLLTSNVGVGGLTVPLIDGDSIYSGGGTVCCRISY